MLIEYRIKFENNGVTIAQRVDSGNAVNYGSQSATSNGQSAVVASNQLPQSAPANVGGNAADPTGPGGNAGDPTGPGGNAADNTGPGGNAADPTGPGGAGSGLFPMVILGAIVIGAPAPAGQSLNEQQPNGKAKGASNAT